MHYVLRPPSLHSDVPPDDVVLCLSIPDSSLVVNEEQPIDGVGVAQPTCAIIHEEYEWELEHQHSAKDDSLPSEPPPFFPNLFDEPAIHDFACVSSSMDAPIVDHSHDSPDGCPSFNNGEDKLFVENPLDLSTVFSRNIEDEFIHFSSTPLAVAATTTLQNFALVCFGASLPTLHKTLSCFIKYSSFKCFPRTKATCQSQLIHSPHRLLTQTWSNYRLSSFTLKIVHFWRATNLPYRNCTILSNSLLSSRIVQSC